VSSSPAIVQTIAANTSVFSRNKAETADSGTIAAHRLQTDARTEAVNGRFKLAASGRVAWAKGGTMIAAIGGIGIVGVIVVVLIVLAIVYFVRRS